jgi:hypothetical protein
LPYTYTKTNGDYPSLDSRRTRKPFPAGEGTLAGSKIELGTRQRTVLVQRLLWICNLGTEPGYPAVIVGVEPTGFCVADVLAEDWPLSTSYSLFVPLSTPLVYGKHPALGGYRRVTDRSPVFVQMPLMQESPRIAQHRIHHNGFMKHQFNLRGAQVRVLVH